MAETDTGVAVGGLDKVIGDAIIAFNEVNVMYPLVNAKQCPRGNHGSMARIYGYCFLKRRCRN